MATTFQPSHSVHAWRPLLSSVLWHALLLTGAFAMILPFLWMILTSLKTTAEVFVFPPRWFPEAPRWSNYSDVMAAMPFGWFMYNSFKIATLSVVGQLLSCSLAAYAFARIEFVGRDTLFMIVLATLMVPSVVTMIPVFILMRELGWLNTHYPLIVPNFLGAAFGIFLLRQFFLGIPIDLEDAARIDGATRFGIYRHIFVPLAKPALATLAVFVFMGQWNDLLGPIIYLVDYDKMTLTVGLAFFRGQYTTNWPLLMAGATMSVIPIIILYLAAQRYFVAGVVMSGLKG
jgi:multiple sugar transport system permease protein